MKWADNKGASSPECIALADLFAKSVDSGKHGGKSEIPSYLHNPGEPNDEARFFMCHYRHFYIFRCVRLEISLARGQKPCDIDRV